MGGALFYILLVLLFLAMLAVFIRLTIGPTLADRVIALDLMGTIIIGVIAAHAVYMELPAVLDVAIILALILFLGTIAFAHYLERRGKQ